MPDRRKMLLCAINNLPDTQPSAETQECNPPTPYTTALTIRNSQPLYLPTSSDGGNSSIISGWCCKYCLMDVTLSDRYVLSRKLVYASGQNPFAASTQCRKYTLQGSTSLLQTLLIPCTPQRRCHSSGGQRVAL
jgi:hypothetical protein